MVRRMPEIFIIGIMKGGTTILYDYLCTHPRVVPGASKEIHYFSLYSDRGPEWYLSHFPERGERFLSIDASPTYFDVAYTPAIPGFIKSAVPNAKVILIIRDPVERAVSHFNHLKLVSYKDSFKDIDINEFFSRSLEGCYSKKTPYDEHLNNILLFSLYYHKFLWYTQVFGRANVMVLTSTELDTNPTETMQRIFKYCGLEWVPSSLFGVHRYVSDSDVSNLKASVRERLARLLYPDFKNFCLAAGLLYPQKSDYVC